MAVDKNNKLLAGLNEQQVMAVKHVGSPLLIVAGAGSGKTTVLVRKIAYLLQNSYAFPYQILAITFTNKAAKQMRDRVIDILGEEAINMWTLTFHSMCVRILRYHIAELSTKQKYVFDSRFTIYDMVDAKRLMNLVLQDLQVDTNKYPLKNFMTQISNWKNDLVFPLDLPEEENTFLRSAKAVYKEYQKRLEQSNALDFDDLIMYTVQLFTELPQVLQLYQQRFKYILVDEYQDTNHAQYRLIFLLTGGKNKDKTGNLPELTVVGDADQSIYAFRGATIRNIEEFTQDFPQAKTIVLEQNYRSTQNILTAANSLISINPNRVKKNLWSALGEGESIVAFAADNEYLESEYVVQQIEQYLAENTNHTYDDIAIIYRTNNVARAFEDAFVRHRIPYRVVGGQKFYDRKEIKDILAYLKLITNPHDDVSFLRIINTPKRGLGDKAIANLRSIAADKNVSLFKACQMIVDKEVEISGRLFKTLSDFYAMIAELSEKAKTLRTSIALANFISLVIEVTGYKDSLQTSLDFTDNSRLENIYELVAVANSFVSSTEVDTDPFNTYEEESSGLLTKFLEQIALSSEADQVPEAGKGIVTCMTLHTAKGLEYPLVFLVGLSEGLFPHFRAFSSDLEMQEERRLAYVGITRAKQKLSLSYAQVRNNYGRPTPVLASRFFQEISNEVMQWLNSDVPRDFLPDYQEDNWQGIPLENKPGDLAAMPGKKLKSIVWEVGDQVNHDKYGLGKIIAKTGENITETITVDFGSFGTLKLMTWGSIPMDKI